MGANPIVQDLVDLQDQLSGINAQLDVVGAAARGEDGCSGASLSRTILSIQSQVEGVEEGLDKAKKTLIEILPPKGGA